MLRETRKFGLLAAAALALSTAVAQAALAADRAVVIGIGNYNDQQVPTLPGIDNDVRTARQAAHVFGFIDSDTTVLADGEATLSRVQAEIHRVLSGSPTDRAFIYFSGHGTHVYDDENKSDGALVMADFRPTGAGHASGALLGHWIGNELKLTHMRFVLLVVDACNSGAITKEYRDTAASTYGVIVNKYYSTPGFSAPHSKLLKDEGSGWLAMSAVQDDQYAPASKIGSPFTNALSTVLSASRRTNSPMTPVQLREAIIAELQRNGIPTDTGPHGANPNVWGDPNLLAQPLPFAKAPGAVWARLQQLVQQSTPGTVNIHMQHTQFHRGDTMQLELDLQRGGYVTVLNVNEKDEAEILIPNAAVPELHLNAGHYVLPRDVKRNWVAEEPDRVLVAIVVTPEKLNLNTGAAGKGLSSVQLLDQLQKKLEAPAGTVRTRLFHDRTTEASQPSPAVTRPEAVSVESEIVP